VPTAINPLDSQELLHLALLASQESRHDAAITLLKQGVEQSPKDARLLFLLGAEHAQIGLYDRAIEEIGRSVQLDASISAAHFELGLLHVMQGDGVRALEAWRPLEALAESDPFRVFAGGLMRLVDNDLDGCIEDLRRGMELSQGNPALAQNMQRILDSALARQAQGGIQPERKADESDNSHVFLSAYRSQ
jgi:tetratricopeptide (TPR) repeat protein